jgi:hypothetical protein
MPLSLDNEETLHVQKSSEKVEQPKEKTSISEFMQIKKKYLYNKPDLITPPKEVTNNKTESNNN